MMPAARPKAMRWIFSEIFFLKKKTLAAPKAVIAKVKPVPAATQPNVVIKSILFSYLTIGEIMQVFWFFLHLKLIESMEVLDGDKHYGQTNERN